LRPEADCRFPLHLRGGEKEEDTGQSDGCAGTCAQSHSRARTREEEAEDERPVPLEQRDSADMADATEPSSDTARATGSASLARVGRALRSTKQRVRYGLGGWVQVRGTDLRGDSGASRAYAAFLAAP
jgi:hypothetical protein